MTLTDQIRAKVAEWRERAIYYDSRFTLEIERGNHVIAAEQGGIKTGFKVCVGELEYLLLKKGARIHGSCNRMNPESEAYQRGYSAAKEQAALEVYKMLIERREGATASANPNDALWAARERIRAMVPGDGKSEA